MCLARSLMCIKKISFTLALLLVCLPCITLANPMSGDWRINLEETDKLSVDFKDGSGIQGRYRGATNISIMGLPLPSRAKAAPMSKLAAKDPAVLTCTEMTLSVGNRSASLTYDNGRKETLREGEYRGRTASLSPKKIEQRYKTTERTVRKTWTLRSDGRLLVAVKVKYQGDKARTYQRVFDRVDRQEPTVEPNAS